MSERTRANCRAKLASLGLRRFVAKERELESGCFQFLCNDVEGLKRELARHALDYDGYTDNERIRRILVRQGVAT